VISPSDILLNLSGGTPNKTALLSIGGDMSSYTVAIATNQSLFSNVTSAQCLSGFIDYRCVYVYNSSDLYPLYGATVEILSQVSTGADISIGCTFNNDIQRIVFSGPFGDGQITLQYVSQNLVTSVIVPYNNNSTNWTNNFINAINSIPGLQVTVTSTVISNMMAVFIINFGGVSAYRYQELFQVAANNMSFTPTIAIDKLQDGSPINSTPLAIASTIAIPPVSNYTSDSIYLGTLQPNDFCPVWIQRAVLPNTPYVENDGFTLQTSGDTTGIPYDPSVIPITDSIVEV
jgi:hypothetical protein